ncbi:hypothetical protein NSU_3621 [Novosphingobium pentaromativorans US6-1]|uniref:Uncharacterized protein n=1 Tax=Novosphingobium pentaromativorans US6-1 TaxID=1088721 RepID=G6EH00_9SPHN|nr:hypothetical protein NSU_3621 [Novosphingobium pentaromativorans US6-1]
MTISEEIAAAGHDLAAVFASCGLGRAGSVLRKIPLLPIVVL